MKPILDPGDREFLERMQPLGAVTIQDLCDSVKVTQTAVRQRLNRLLSGGWILRQTVKAHRGRPYHSYTVSPAGLRELGDNYADLAQILWRELRNIPDAGIRKILEGRIRDALVEQYSKSVNAPELRERMQQLAALLESSGFSVHAVDVTTDGPRSLPVLRENNCPYHELAASDESICDLEQQVFERVLGVPLTMTHRCRNGDGHCEFHPIEAFPAPTAMVETSVREDVRCGNSDVAVRSDAAVLALQSRNAVEATS